MVNADAFFHFFLFVEAFKKGRKHAVEIVTFGSLHKTIETLLIHIGLQVLLGEIADIRLPEVVTDVLASQDLVTMVVVPGP